MIHDFSKREKECFDVLHLLKKNMHYVVIGGYAVSSYGFPRFSVDLDIVIPEEDASFFRKLITNADFIFQKEKTDLGYAGKFERYTKGLVSIDLLINAVQSRQTGFSYSFPYLLKHSKMNEVRGWGPTVKASIRVPNREMLIALKMHSMRSADKRDIIMLCYKNVAVDKIVTHLIHSPREKIIENINDLLTVITNQNLKDSLKGVFSISDVVFDKAVDNCIRIMEKIHIRLSS